MKKISMLFIAAALLCLPAVSHAQRTAYGERQISMDVHGSLAPSYGVSLSYGQYLLTSYWEGGLSLDNILKTHESGIGFGNARVEGYGAFLYRIFGTRDRAFSVYGGGDVFLGFEFLDPFRQLPDPTWQSMLNGDFKSYKFIYGVAPRVEGEYFLSKDLALTLRLRIPVTLNGQFRSDLVGFHLGLGVRYNF